MLIKGASFCGEGAARRVGSEMVDPNVPGLQGFLGRILRLQAHFGCEVMARPRTTGSDGRHWQMSMPELPPLSMPLQQIYSRRWTSESKRFLHVRKERKWMASTLRHRFMDFAPQERIELRRYFDELASSGRIGFEDLETMLISLGLAEDSKDVRAWAEQVDDLQLGALDFEQFLQLLLKRKNSNLVSVFRQMASGQLGDPSLNFQTIISEYRRKLIMDAAGLGNTDRQQPGRGRCSSISLII